MISIKSGKCRICGKRILWVLTTAGKKIPVNPTLLPFWNGRPRRRIVLQDGRTVNVSLQGDREKVSGYGYIPHFCRRTK